MADLYRDFVFTRCTTPVGATDTNVSVEDITLFPGNNTLARGEFFVAFESSLSYPHSFEICRLLSVNSATKTLTLQRAQGGTTAVSHAIVTYIKGTLTADMVRRARQGYQGSIAPSPDSDVFVVGDRFFNTTDNRLYAFTGRAGWFVDTFTRAASALTMGSTELVTTTAGNLAPQAPYTLPYVGTWQAPVGIWGINATNQAYFVSGAVANTASAILNVGGLDVDFSFDVFASTTAGSDYGLWFRASAELNYGYYLQFNGTTATLFRVNNGVFSTTSQTTTYTTGVPHTWRVTAIGAALTVYRDGTSVITFTESVTNLLPATNLIGAGLGPRIGNVAATTDVSLYWDNFKATTPNNTAPNTPLPQGWAPTSPTTGTATDPGAFSQAQLASVEGAVTNIVQQLDDVIQADANVESTVTKHDIDLMAIYSTVDDLLPVVQDLDIFVTDLAATSAATVQQTDDILDVLKGSVSTTGNGPPSATAGVATGALYEDDQSKRIYAFTGTAWVPVTYSGPGAVSVPAISRGFTTQTSGNTIAYPAGTSVGDCAVYSQIDYRGGPANIPVPAGWTIIYQGYAPNAYWCQMLVAYKNNLTAADLASNTLLFDGNTSWICSTLRTYGNSTYDTAAYTPVNSYSAIVNVPSLSAPSVNATGPGVTVEIFMANGVGNTAITGPTGASNVSAFGNGQSYSWSGEYTQATAGATPVRTATINAGSPVEEAITVEILSVPRAPVYGPINIGAGVPTATTFGQGAVYQDTTSNAIYVYTGALWLGVTPRVISTTGDYTAKGNDYILADTTASGRSSTLPSVDAFVQDVNSANPATQTLTSTGATDLFVGIRASWLGSPFTATLDGATFTRVREQSTYAGTSQATGAMFASGPAIAPGAHTIVYSGPTSYGIAWAETIALRNCTAVGAIYSSVPGNNLTISVPPTSSGIIVLYAQVNGGTPPSITGAGGLTWTARGSQAHGSQNASTCWTAPYPAGTSSVAVTFSPNDTSYGFTIAGAFPANGDPTVYDAANYSVITLPSGAISSRVFVQSNDQASNAIRVQPAGGGLINGSASPDIIATRYQGALYVSNGTNWFKIVQPGGGGGGTAVNVVTKTSAYTASNGDVVLANASTAAFAVTTPFAAANLQIEVKKTDASSNAVTVTPANGLIDGQPNFVLARQYDAVTIVSDGTNWWVA